jgi:hypothetical protein
MRVSGLTSPPSLDRIHRCHWCTCSGNGFEPLPLYAAHQRSTSWSPRSRLSFRPWRDLPLESLAATESMSHRHWSRKRTSEPQHPAACCHHRWWPLWRFACGHYREPARWRCAHPWAAAHTGEWTHGRCHHRRSISPLLFSLAFGSG